MKLAAWLLLAAKKAFAAGADIAAMADYNYMDAYKGNHVTKNWSIFCVCANRSSLRWLAMRSVVVVN